VSRLLLTGSGPELEGRVCKAFDGTLNGELRRADDPGGLLDWIAVEQPLVVAIGPSLSPDAALSLAGSIDRCHPEVVVVLLTEPGPDLWERALRAGVRDVIAPDAALPDVRAGFESAFDAGLRRRACRPAPEPERTSRVITVVSPKGGSGKTAIATNLAVGLAKLAPGQVVLVDLDLQFGDVANAMRLTPDQTIADAARAAAAIDETTIKAYLTAHPAECFALCAPNSPAEAEEVSVDHASRLIELLSGLFPYVVVDTAAGLDEWTLAALEASTDMVLLASTDVASARSIRKALDAFDLLGLTTQRRHLVLNRADARVGLAAADIESAVGTKVTVSVPSSRSVPLSMNQGIPILESAQRTPVSRALGELVNRLGALNAAAGPESATGSLLRRRKATR